MEPWSLAVIPLHLQRHAKKKLYAILPDEKFKVILYLVYIKYKSVMLLLGDRGGSVVKVLCYQSEERWFDCRWCHWNFSLT